MTASDNRADAGAGSVRFRPLGGLRSRAARPEPAEPRAAAARAHAGRLDQGEASSFSPPHERALAAAWRWHGSDGALPFAARAAAADGIDVGDHAWGLVTPAHWQLGRDHVALLDPDLLTLDEADSRALFDAVRPWLETDGFRAAWGAPGRWYIARDDLAGLPTASLDRAIGRSVDAWLVHPLAASPAQRASSAALRRLQSEAQLLLHVHPVNEAREERGALPVNSFWLSGCGTAQPATDAATPEIAATLRAPLLAGDWAAWAEAWRALDATLLARLLEASQRSEAIVLTLCGECSAARFERRPRSLWQRLAGPRHASAPHAVLASL